MSRTHKTSPYWSGTRNTYKGMRVRKERARLREYLNQMDPKADYIDVCGFQDCECCGTLLAADAGPTHELAYWDWWEIT